MERVDNSACILVDKALHLLAQQQYQEALNLLAEAQVHPVPVRDLYYAQGLALCALGRNEEAIPCIQRELQVFPDNEQGYECICKSMASYVLKSMT